jgi:hypothetical protein
MGEMQVMLAQGNTIVSMSDLELSSLLELNNAHATETSWLDETRLKRMMQEARYAFGIVPAAAFLMAFDQDADYDSLNFHWFRERYKNFIYIDRIVVSAASRRQGLAGALYTDLFRWAALRGYDLAVCEVNEIPPNPVSEAFHRKLGFTQVGEACLSAGKQVRYLARSIGTYVEA